MISTNELIAKFQTKAFKCKSLFQLEIDVTSECNCNCPFCFQGEHKKSEKALSLDDYNRLFFDLRNKGVFYIGFSGGEPFLNPDFMNILKLAKNYNFRVSFVSNGHFITKSQIDEMADLYIDSMNISFHSVNANKYKTIFGIANDDYYRTALMNIEYMLKKNLNVGIDVTITKNNISEIPKIYDFFSAKGIKPNKISFNTLLNGKKDVTSLRPSVRQLAKYKKYIYHADDNSSNRTLHCSAGAITCCIDSLGNVYPCTFIHISAGNILERSIEDIWDNAPVFKFFRSFSDDAFKKCHHCEIKEKCNVCFATNLNDTGNPFEASDYYCLVKKGLLL